MSYSVSTLKRMRSDEKQRKRTYEKRISSLEKVSRNRYKLDDYYSRIKNDVNKCTGELFDGISGMGAVLDGKCSAISALGEQQCLSNQYNFSVALSYISNEMNRCQQEIYDCERKIRNYENQIKEQGGILLPWE